MNDLLLSLTDWWSHLCYDFVWKGIKCVYCCKLLYSLQLISESGKTIAIVRQCWCSQKIYLDSNFIRYFHPVHTHANTCPTFRVWPQWSRTRRWRQWCQSLEWCRLPSPGRTDTELRGKDWEKQRKQKKDKVMMEIFHESETNVQKKLNISTGMSQAIIGHGA